MGCSLNRLFSAIRGGVQTIGVPFGAALYTVAGFCFPYTMTGVLLLATYVVLRFTLAKETALETTPPSKDISSIIANLPAVAVLLLTSLENALIVYINYSVQLWLGAEPYSLTPMMIAGCIVGFSVSFVTTSILSYKIINILGLWNTALFTAILGVFVALM